eukprot:TRINITY_DN2101_c0_g1_i1.p1 TRINITY_DN2101_c0_g1~~TRINITY_DN2101_c0_g1_i1.p1  ORF type:complete len:821 (-),score=238.69 TRINITY_DN2101_c0_g1_i1:205-2667(-)
MANMAIRLVLAVVLATPFLGAAVTARMQMQVTATARFRSTLHNREHAHKKSIAKIMSNMTLHSALETLHKGSHSKSKAVAMMQEVLLQKSKAHHSRGKLRAHKAADPTGYAAVQPAIDEINKMIEETQEKYDLEVDKCCEFDESQRALMMQAEIDRAEFDGKATEARKGISRANGDISDCETKLDELSGTIQEHWSQCDLEKKDLRGQLKIVNADLKVMGEVLKLTKCKDTTPGATTGTEMFLQRCVDGCGSFMAIGHKELHKAVAQLQSSVSKELLQGNLQELAESEAANTTEATTWSPDEVPDRTVDSARPCQEELPADDRTAKCSISSIPNCDKIKEKFLYIEAGIGDKKDELEDTLATLEHGCETMGNNLVAQKNDQKKSLEDAQTELADSTERETMAMEDSRLKGQQLETMHEDYEKMTKTCHANYATLESEQCGLDKIRGELVKLEGQNNPAFFQDCVVSDWVPDECSVTCGGGIRSSTRTITTHPVGGAKCPALKMQEKCNEHKCPIDCVLEDWTGWSACTAKCGGGVINRQRRIAVEPKHGGEPCGETTEATRCNEQACDKDCELNEWTKWSDCSKECDGGYLHRVRTISEPPVGEGECPHMYSWRRLEWQRCNQFACRPKAETLICRDSLDVVLVIDGSGSIGSRGWTASVKAAEMLAKAFKGDGGSDNMLAVLLFSWQPEIIQHFTKDFDKAITAIKGMSWPMSVTYTGRALDFARNELALGRADAHSITIVLTDGRPMSTRYTKTASTNLKKYSRLMFVPVTRWAPLRDIKQWASLPREDNIVAVRDFNKLTKPDTINQIIADACHHVS